MLSFALDNEHPATNTLIKVLAIERNRMPRPSMSNPLALAVLGLLVERPMHPYEMSRTMHERRKEHSIKINYGSLYSVVERLARSGAIEPCATVRDGRRPERTVYRLTAAGRAKFDGWLASILRTPAKEFPQFMAGLSLLPGLPPDTVVELLEERAENLRTDIERQRGELRELSPQLPRLFWIEHDYEVAMAEAELAFVERLIADIRDQRLEGIDLWTDEKAWRQWYAARHDSTESATFGTEIDTAETPAEDTS